MFSFLIMIRCVCVCALRTCQNDNEMDVCVCGCTHVYINSFALLKTNAMQQLDAKRKEWNDAAYTMYAQFEHKKVK